MVVWRGEGGEIPHFHSERRGVGAGCVGWGEPVCVSWKDVLIGLSGIEPECGGEGDEDFF